MGKTDAITKQVASFVSNTSYKDLPQEVVTTSKNHILDGLGVILAGANQEVGLILQRYIQEIGGTNEASILGTNLSTPMENAALANGVAGHAMDYDDTQIAIGVDRVTGLLTHPTIPALSAALAVGEKVGASGKEFLTAFNIGVEVECKIAEAINPNHYQIGFHTTGTIGGFGAVAAAGKLLGLSEEAMQNAFGLVGSMAAGLRVNFGTMAKPFHSGRSAQNGVLAARLTQTGFVSTHVMLDSQWGFFQVYGGGVNEEIIKDGLGNPFNMLSPGISIKPYPCGSLAHPTMDVTLAMMQENHLDSNTIKRIEVAVASNVLNALLYMNPTTPLEAKFSLPFGIAMIVLKGRAGVHEYKQNMVDDPEVRKTMQKIHCYVDEEIERKGYHKMFGKVTIHLEDGSALSKDAEVARGYPDNPMSQMELETKFRDCASLSIPNNKVNLVIEKLFDGFEELEHIGKLTSIMVL